MIRLGHFLTGMLFSLAAYAQAPDTLVVKKVGEVSDTARKALNLQTSSALKRYSTAKDSLRALVKTSRFTDSMKIERWSGDLRGKIEARFSERRLSKSLDSLRTLNVPSARITHFSDSLTRKKAALLNEVGGKQKVLRQRVTERYKVWTERARPAFNLDSAGVRPPNLDPSIRNPLTTLELPNVPQPTSTPIPGASPLPAPGIESPAMPGLTTGDFASLGLSEDLTAIGGNLAIPDSDQLASMSSGISTLPNGSMPDVKALTSDPGAMVQKAVGEVKPVAEATQKLNEAENLKQQNEAMKMAEDMKNPDALKEQAVNHFEGQEAALQGAITQMSKHKRKYASLGSLSEIKKNDWLPRNGLKGKPFRERVRFGLHAGFKGKGDTLLLDFYPNASYRLTGRLEAGLGASYRVRLNTRDVSLDQHNPVWGAFLFAVVKTFRSVHLRVEVDGNSFPKSAPPDRPATRDWRWTFHTGIQTNFKLGSRWSGVIQMLYNFDSNLKDGFPEKLTARVGVQYKLNK
jgi:hypothetical protein